MTRVFYSINQCWITLRIAVLIGAVLGPVPALAARGIPGGNDDGGIASPNCSADIAPAPNGDGVGNCVPFQ